MKRFLPVLFLFFITGITAAQNGILSGTVTNAVSNEPLPFVTILVNDTLYGTQTDIDGKFLIEKMTPGLYNISFTYIGFKKKTIYEVQVTNAVPLALNIQMEEDAGVLDVVTIKATPNDKTDESPTSLKTIGTNEIQRNPGGNRDISRVIQSLPGVTYTPSFRNDIIIRGGAPNENRFYLDDVEVPNINHFATQGSSGGPVGMINVDFIQEVAFYTGAFPAADGNALSSVMEIRMREGRKDAAGGTTTLGSSDLGITLEGPTGKNSSILFSARRSYLQFLFDALGLPFLPTYNDFQFKEKININTKNTLEFIALGAIDQFALNTKDDTSAYQKYILDNLPVQEQWNYTVGAVYTHYRSHGYAKVILSRNMLKNDAYKYLNNDESVSDNLLYDYTSTEAENKLRYTEYWTAKGFRYSAGIQYMLSRYTNSTFQKIPFGADVLTIDYQSKLFTHTYGVYATAAHTFWNVLDANIGLRADGNSFDASTRNPLNQISPRLALSYALTPNWSINANTGIYYQLPAYTVLGYRDSLGTLVNKENNVTYISATHFTLGLEYRPEKNVRFTLEGFYKIYDNYPFSLRDSVSLANLGADFGVIGDEPVTSTSKGKSYGIEFFAQQRLYKNFYGILSVTFVRSLFEDKQGDYVASSWDNRSIIALTAGKKFAHDWELGVKFRYSGGLPYTPYDVQYSTLTYVWDINHQAVPDFDQLNSERLKPYHQLDMRLDKKWYLDKVNIDVYLDVQNVYAYKVQLPPILDVVKDVNDNPVLNPDDPSRYQVSYIDNESGTVLPSIGVVVEF
ncbi:MAG: TonB-dependent receptor [Chitinophagales bacterium]